MEPTIISLFADAYDDGLEQIADYDLSIGRDELYVRNDYRSMHLLKGSPVSIALFADKYTYRLKDGYVWVPKSRNTSAIYYEPCVDLKFVDLQKSELMTGPDLFATILVSNDLVWLNSLRIVFSYPPQSEKTMLKMDQDLELEDEDLSPSEPSL